MATDDRKDAPSDDHRASLVQALWPKINHEEPIAVEIDIRGELIPDSNHPSETATQNVPYLVPLLFRCFGSTSSYRSDDSEFCWLGMLWIGGVPHHIEAVLVWRNPLTHIQESVLDPYDRLESFFDEDTGPLLTNVGLLNLFVPGHETVMFMGRTIDVDELELGIVMRIYPHSD